VLFQFIFSPSFPLIVYKASTMDSQRHSQRDC
jgi:hypothetical protein